MVCLLEIEDNNVSEHYHHHHNQCYGKSSNSSNSDLTDNEQFRINPVEEGEATVGPLPIILKARRGSKTH